jgi:hypothetical protein
MSVEIAWKQNILVTDFHLLKSMLVVLGFGSQAFVCGFSRQNINSVQNCPEYSIEICLSKYKRFSEFPAFEDQQFREKTKLIHEVSQLAKGVTDSMSELQEVQESVLDMKKFLDYHC